MSTYPVVFDDGSKAMVPQEKLQGALKDGGKLAQAMQFDDGSKAYVPFDKVHDAVHDGGMLIGDAPKAPAAPQMQQSALGGLMGGPTGDSTNSNLPTPKGQMAQQTTPSPAVGALTLGGTAALALGSGAEAALPTIARVAAKHPIMSAMVASEAIKEARKIPVAGRFIPPMAEMAPFLFSGGKGAPAAEAEAGTSAAAGEEAAAAPEPVAPKPQTAPIYRDATLNRRNFPDNAGEDYGDLKAATKDVVDSAVPASANRGVNLTTKAQIDMKLRNGDVEGAEQVLDQAAKKANPSYTAPDRPQIVPATQNIRENDALVSSAENASPKQVRGYREAQDDAGVSQEMRANLDTHGYRAESEARREFIARNSTGTTKGEMAQQVTSKTIDPATMSLQEKLQAMLDAAKAAKR